MTTIVTNDGFCVEPGMILIIDPYKRNIREQILAYLMAVFSIVAAWNPCNNFAKLTRPFLKFVKDGGLFREIVSVDSATTLTIK